jgi:hypothetical protein
MNYYNAIVFFVGERKPAKYRKISETNLLRFRTFCSNASAKYINLYCNKTKDYIKRIYL